MINREVYLEEKQAQIDMWIGKLDHLDALCRDAGNDVKGEFKDQIKELSQNLDELDSMFSEFQELNDYGREKFRNVVEKNWREIEESFEYSISEYEHMIRARAKE